MNQSCLFCVFSIIALTDGLGYINRSACAILLDHVVSQLSVCSGIFIRYSKCLAKNSSDIL
jgi:hypothetical protein